MTRPNNLPFFANPPLNDVVIGVQFAQPKGYQQIRAGEVWSLFKDDFPNVEEHLPLQPTFETFGLPTSGQINFGILTNTQHQRYLFISENKNELIQFQNDRFLHNWRKNSDQNIVYPRYENIIKRFESNIQKLEAYFSTLYQQHLSITQCEISYVNHIYLDNMKDINTLSDLFTFLNFPSYDPDEVTCQFREKILNINSQPIGRLICDVTTNIDIQQRRFQAMTLTARGAPFHDSIESALEFIKLGHNIITKKFTDLTSAIAHSAWGRQS